MWGVGCAIDLLAVSVWVAFRAWPRQIRLIAEPLPSVHFDQCKMIVPLPTEALLAEVGRFDNEISAYLWFDYLKLGIILVLRNRHDRNT